MADRGPAGSPRGELSPEARALLLRAAREAIRRHLRGLAPAAAPRAPVPLAEPRGVFVSLHAGGGAPGGRPELRGCVGYPLPGLELGEAVVDCAVGAASRDARFAPVNAREEPGLRIQISVLSVPEPGGPEDIVIGRHGLLVTALSGEGSGLRRGLLLPQVAVEHALSAAEFLTETCRKAGLAPAFDARRARLELFTAEVFEEPA